MASRSFTFSNDEVYHIFNRGVDKRNIFSDNEDIIRFFQSLNEFNTLNPIGSLYENSFTEKNKHKKDSSQLVNIVCYCLNSNHFHLLLQQDKDEGITTFMQRVGTGFTKYFNRKYKRTGSLFQGKFKAVPVVSNEKLLELSVYINLNYKIHQLGSLASKLVRSSWDEYTQSKALFKKNTAPFFCKKDIILQQFNSLADYKKYADETLPLLIDRKREEKELEKVLLE